MRKIPLGNHVRMDPVRAKLRTLIASRGDSYAGISLLLGRNPAYIHQFITRGSPRKLSEEDRRVLARHYGVPEEDLGGQETLPPRQEGDWPLITIPILSLGASAGHGSLQEQEKISSSMSFDRRWMRRLGVQPSRVSVISVDGDSMAPTLHDGDEIMVDHDDGASRLRDGIYVLRLDGALMVKRVAVGLMPTMTA